MGNLFAVSSLDSQFSFHDLNAEKRLGIVQLKDSSSNYS